MNRSEEQFFNLVQKLGQFKKRPMFGGIGLFIEDAIFSFIVRERLYIRGGGGIDEIFEKLGCERLQYIKKSGVATVNYFDVSDLFDKTPLFVTALVQEAVAKSRVDLKVKKSKGYKKLRQLPNMQLRYERMAKKAGIPDVDSFFETGAVSVFKKVNTIYGGNVDIKLLWKFVGAELGIHWTLLDESEKTIILLQM